MAFKHKSINHFSSKFASELRFVLCSDLMFLAIMRARLRPCDCEVSSAWLFSLAYSSELRVQAPNTKLNFALVTLESYPKLPRRKQQTPSNRPKTNEKFQRAESEKRNQGKPPYLHVARSPVYQQRPPASTTNTNKRQTPSKE